MVEQNQAAAIEYSRRGAFHLMWAVSSDAAERSSYDVDMPSNLLQPDQVGRCLGFSSLLTSVWSDVKTAEGADPFGYPSGQMKTS